MVRLAQALRLHAEPAQEMKPAEPSSGPAILEPEDECAEEEDGAPKEPQRQL